MKKNVIIALVLSLSTLVMENIYLSNGLRKVLDICMKALD